MGLLQGEVHDSVQMREQLFFQHGFLRVKMPGLPHLARDVVQLGLDLLFRLDFRE